MNPTKAAIWRCVRFAHKPVTVRQLAHEVGRSISTVHGHLKALEEEGRIERVVGWREKP